MVAPIRYLSRRVQEEKIGILQSTENKKVLEVVGRVGIGTTIFDPGYQLDIRGDANIRDSLTVDSITITGAGNSFSGITTFVDTTNNVLGDPDTGAVQIDGGLGVNKNVTVGAGLSVAETAYIVGVSTFRDRVIFDSTNSIQIPSGTEGEKDIVGVAVTGQIRFNTTNQQFEGFGVGNNWGSLGGVRDVDGDTEIKAELSAGSDEDTLYFYTGGYLSGTISSTTGVDLNVDLNVDGHIETDTLNVSGLSTFASNVDVNASVDISNNLVVDGLSDLDELNVAGLSTFTLLVDANGGIDASSVKVEDLTDNRVVIAGTGGELEDDANFTFDGSQLVVGAALTVTGVSTFASDVDVNASVDISTNLTVDGLSDLDELNVAGISSFSSNVFVSGKLGVGTDVSPTGKFEVVGGDAVFRENVDIYQNLFVAGTISVAGTSVILDSETVRIEDKDLVLGFTTTITPNDTTANHGGIAIASTEGYPLVPLYVAGINTLPDTYKQFMWVKSGTYTGLTTDAWISNYAVSIGSTELESGVGLGVGTAVRIYNSGIISATSYYGSGGNLEDIIREKIEGITTKFVDSDGTETTLGDALSVSELTINNDNATVGYITAVGFGSTAIYYFNDPIARGLTTDASINTTGIVTFQSDVNVGLGATLALFDISSGRIGIGTIAPSQTLDVNGNARFRGAIYDNNNVVGGANSILTSTGSGVVWADITTIPVGDANTLDGLDSTQFLRSDVADTKTGITTFTDDLVIADKITHQSDTDTAIRFPANDTFTVETAGSERLRVTSTGDVGIGTDNPSEKLHTIGDVMIQGTGGTGEQSLFIGKSATFIPSTRGVAVAADQNSSADHDMVLKTSTSSSGLVEQVRITSAGDVGIGTTAPTAKLHVVGGVSITGNIDVDNTTSIGSKTSSLSTLTQTAIHTELDIATYRSVEYNIQVTEGTNFHATKILALHNGTTAYHSEYGTIFNNSSVAAFDVDVSGGNLRLLASGASASQTDYVINFVATKI